jgi:hypothetical protein
MVFTDLGFTGTRNALVAWQTMTVLSMLDYHRALGFTRFHHGDCTGADEFAARWALDLGYYVICHPPEIATHRAFTYAHETRPPLPYLDRNTEIVRESHAGLAVPNSSVPRERSGTWSTIRKMVDARVPYWVVSPDRLWCGTPGRDTLVPQ